MVPATQRETGHAHQKRPPGPSASSGSPRAPPSDLGPARGAPRPRTSGPRPASRRPSPRPSAGGTLRPGRHRARPCPPALTARRSRRGAAARNMVTAAGRLRTVCLGAAASPANQSPQRSRERRARARGLLRAHWAAAQPMGTAESGARRGSRAKVRQRLGARRWCGGARSPPGPAPRPGPAPAPMTSRSWLPAR